MTVEPTMNAGIPQAEPTQYKWADDGGVLTEERRPEPETTTTPDTSFGTVESGTPTTVETKASEEAGAATETSMEATANPVVREPLLTDEFEQAFLTRWAQIQVGFVEDPAASVRNADGLIGEIATALLESFQARRADLAADWQHTSPGTEELRLALRRYRAFIGVILPK
jgi:hypothetical protein